MALTRITSGGIAEGITIKFDQNNSPTAPAIGFEGVGNAGTGIYSPAVNEVAIATSGQPRLTFKSDGKIVTGNGTILGGTNPDFLGAKNITLYVNQSDLNATDSEDNDGGNLNRPFKTIERALLEAARKSYKPSEPDKFEAFTIMVMPGQYEIDNRPGYDVRTNPLTAGTTVTVDNGLFRFNPRNGGVVVPRGTSIVGYDLRKTVIRPKYVPIPSTTTTTEEGSITNDGYILSHVMYDGATMIERNRGYIQEQTKLYLAATQAGYTSLNDTKKELCIRDIGYFIDAVIADLREGGNENTFINSEYYIDGNGGYRDKFLNAGDGNLTAEVTATQNAFIRAALLMRYTVENNWGSYTEYTSGKTITRTSFSPGNGYLSNGDCSTVASAVNVLGQLASGILAAPDTYTTIYRKTQGVFKQTSIFKVTGGCYFWQMTFKDALGTPYNSASFDANGIPSFTTAPNANYSHHKVVAFTYADQRTTDGELDQYYKKIDAWDQTFDNAGTRDVRPEEYTIVGDGSTNITIDTVNSCSPYIFNCSLRSVFGMCGMHTDGSKVAENSFKSMVVAQFTGISLQKDANAFFQPKDLEGDRDNPLYNDDITSTTAPPIYADPDAQYKHDWRHFHIKASNGGFIQVVSVFAVGYADQFLAESGGDMSITNSNSNFGQISLRAKGSQFNAFKPASQGKITAIIPPKGIAAKATDVTFYNIDRDNTWERMGQSDNLFVSSRLSQFSSDADQLRLYLEIGNFSSEGDIPELVVEAPDYSQTPDGNGEYPTVTKRYLTFGTTNQYALFRDFYNTSGTTDSAYRYVKTEVEGTDGDKTQYFAKVYFTGTTAENAIGNNSQRQGYFWDPIKNRVYLKLDGTDAQTKSFLSGFVFRTKSEEVFSFIEDIADDGSITTKFVSTVQNILEYFDGFPAGLTVTKNEDNRGSTPSDLLWRVEYTIPKDCAEIPKPPEKRFVIKGIRPGNGEDGMPYTDYRFMVWDVEEYLTWERNVRDGVYYLTLIRADVNKFVDGNDNAVTKVVRRPTAISAGSSFACSFIEEVNNYDKDTRLVSNVNYLYPSVNEEGPTYDVRRTWNPPQADSRVLIEKIGAGTRIKDLTVPNYTRYRGGSTPFRDVPAMYSITAEAVHRLVQAFDLRYAQASTRSTANIAVAPVVGWDDRTGLTTLGYNTSVDIYGPSATYRIGKDKSTRTIQTNVNAADYNPAANINLYGIVGDSVERRIIVCNSSKATFTTTELNNYTIGQTLLLYRPSILRASSHTWEYIGLGSGNYSTGFPQLQTRVLKPYEQYIAQGYENAGGFVASSGTNSNGDFYIGTQIIQAGGSSTVSLNVPKVRKSSESNYVDIENIENRISNSVVNVTASTAGKSGSAQSAIKALSNFFNAEKLSVSNIATINSLIVQEKLYISNASINNAAFFPEANTNAYGFVKGAKPEKTGFISTDTNDKLYVSPKYLDAWRVKRQLISASAVTLDNNRIYIEPYTQALVDSYDPTTGIYEGLSLSYIQTKIANNQQIRLYLKETSGLPSYGSIDIEMSLQQVEITDYKVSAGSRSYLNPKISVTLKYDEIDYTENYIVISKFQNNFPIVDYIKSCLGTSEYNQIIKSYTGFLTNGAFGIDASEADIKYLTAKLSSDVAVDSIGSPIPADSSTYKNISITTTATEWNKWPNRGALSLREYPRGTASNQYRVSTYVYFKSSTQGTFTLIKKVGNGSTNDAGHTYRADYENKYPGIDDKNVFFAGCNTIVSFSDRWASESPFIPPLDPTKGSVEDVNIEEATLYEIPVKSVPSAVDINEDYISQNLPNPFSSKALGVNIQNRTAVKKFAPLSYFKQVQSWCENSGFNPTDEVELLMKPGYYKLDGSVFPCKIKINGSGLVKSSVFAGKEQTGISAGRMGGYLEDSIKRGDSIYFYRSPVFNDQWGFGNDAIYVDVPGGLTSKGGFNLTNVHFLGLNEAVTKNEIPDTLYSNDDNTISARRLVRKAYYTKSFIKKYYNTKTEDGVDGALSFTANTSVSVGQTKAELNWIVNSDNVINSSIDSQNYGELNSASATNSRYMIVRLKASNFAADSTSRRNFALARKYIIPGTTMYWLNTNTAVSILSDKTKVISVRKVNQSTATTWGSDSTEEIHVMVSIYRTPGSPNYQGNLSSRTNIIEDLNISGYTTGDKKLVFLNEDGAEFTTLTYNWALNRRRNFLPKGFMHEGGYQPAIIKRVTTAVNPGAGSSGVTITLDNVDLLQVGDKIVGAGIQPGTRIASIPPGTKTIVTSDNISSAIAAKTPLSFTQFNDFGDEIQKYDIPEIFGITRSSDNSYISLIIDRNPNYDIDNTISPYPYGAQSFSLYPTALIQSKTSHSSVTTQFASPEDCAYAIPRARAYTKRVSGFQESRFVILDINPNSIADLASINPANPQNSSLNSYIENAGINADLIKEFASYNPNIFSFGGGVGTGFAANTINFAGESTPAAIAAKLNAAITNNGRKYNGYATATLSPAGGTGGTGYVVYPIINTAGGAGTITGFGVYTVGATQVAFNGNWTITVSDRKGFVLSPTGRTVDVNSTRLDGDDFTFVAKTNFFAAVRVTGNGTVVPGSPYVEDYNLDSFGDIDVLSARGKKIYSSWPQSYRALRRRFPSAPGDSSSAVNGNYQSSLINVDAIPGSNFDLNLSGVTIGAQSPASEAANTFGGGYRGGLIRCRGSKLTLSGTRFRGNLSLDWTGLLSNTNSRAGGLFIAGHSIEMFQMEDQNSFERIGGERPAQHILTSKEDEEFRKITEYDPLSNVFLEPSKDPYGQLSDGDSRTFPISTNQAIRRYNLSPSSITAWDGTVIPPGGVQTRLSLFERYQAPYPLYYDNTTTTNPTSIPNDTNGNKYVELSNGTKASAIRLRWNNSSSTTRSTGTTVTSGDLATLPPKTLTFLYPADTDSGQDLVNNIFFGANATKIVKTTNIETTYATVTRLTTYTNRFDKDGNPSANGAYKLARIKYSGNIPSEIGSTSGSNIQINTRYLDSKRYNYVSTVTSRYQKTVVNGTSKLILATDNNVNTFAEHADLAIGSANITPNVSRATILSLRNLDDNTATDGKVRMSTNSAGVITSLDILDYGSGHKEGAKLAIYNGAINLTSAIQITARRNLDIDVNVLGDSEYMAILPQNCFILNGVNQPSTTAIKQKLVAARTIFKPGSYILLGGTYYRIANTDTTNSKPYLGIYKYINTSNLSDQRADIVVMLEDPEYDPTYPANTRVDLFDYDNILDYWPSSGRMVIGNRETCDFQKVGDPTTNTGYELRLTRSMTKYWPHYIRDWEGLDPNDSTDATVTLSSLESTILRLADPVDVTCYGLRRVFPSTNSSNQSFGTLTVPEYVSPTGIVSNKIARVSIASNNVDNDFQKLSIGQPVTIPYKNITDTYDWSGCTITVGDAQYTAGASNSTNRAGDRMISGTIRSTNTFETRDSRTFNIFGSSATNMEPYQYVNPLTAARFSSPRGETFRIGPAGFVSWNYMWTPLHESANAGQANIKISPAYVRSTHRLGSDAVFTATITDINNTTDPTERILTVTGVTSGGLYKGQPIRTGGTVGSGTLIGYVVGFEGDAINESGTYEDDIVLTGNGGSGVYRIQLQAGVTPPSGSQTFNGQKSGNSDYLVWMRNHCCWTRVITSKSVDATTKVATITLNANLIDPDAQDGNPNTTSVYAGDWVLWYYQSFTDNSVRLILDKPLIENIPEGTTLSLCPCNHQNEGYFGEAGIRETNSFVFKSKIIDIEKDTNKLNIYLADDYPDNYSSSAMRSYGLMYVNSGGWTYPKTGGSSFRPNNAIMTAPDANGIGTTIQLPNRSGRIQAGDLLTYTWEDELVVESTSHAGGTITINNSSTIATQNDQRSYIFPGAVIYDASSNLIGTVTSVTSNAINLNTTYTGNLSSHSGWKYTSTGRTYTFSSQIFSVTTTSGVATCTLASADQYQILHTLFANKKLWLSIDEIFVSHREGNFTNDGPVVKKFIYTDTGVKLTFGDYRIWYERYQNYIRAGTEPGGQEISGRQGWVGNFGLTNAGERAKGLVMNGASSVQWGRQYNYSMWLTAVPVHAIWESVGYGNYMMQINQNIAGIESNYALNTLTSYDRVGRFKLNALNHTSLNTGSIYAGLNHGAYISGGGESYDTKQYQFTSSVRLKYNLQNGTVSGTGTVAGGDTSRLSEQYIVDRIIHYKPSLSITDSRITQTLAISITQNTATLTGTGIGSRLLPGDVVYSGSTPTSSNRIGIVKSVAADGNSVTLSMNYTGTTISGNTSWSYISPRVKHAGTTNAPSNALVFSGGGSTSTTDINDVNNAGFNVAATSATGYNRYNYRFNINRRTFNQTVLLNTYDQLLATKTIDDASKVIDINLGDLSTYRSPLMNVEVTRLNPKTHIEQSISVVGNETNI